MHRKECLHSLCILDYVLLCVSFYMRNMGGEKNALFYSTQTCAKQNLTIFSTGLELEHRTNSFFKPFISILLMSITVLIQYTHILILLCVCHCF